MRQIHSEEVLARTLERYAAQGAQGKAPAARGRGGARKNGGEVGASMDARTYGIGAQILFELGVRRLHLLTNHPKRIQGLEGYGLRITRQTPLPRTEGREARKGARAGARKGKAAREAATEKA